MKNFFGNMRFQTSCVRTVFLAFILVLLLVSVVVWLPKQTYADGDPNVKITITIIEATEKGFLVKGAVTGAGLNPEGQIVENDTISIIADIETGPNAKYPLLPQSMYVRAPAGAESPYTKGSGPGGTMTKAEEKGVGITSVVISSFELRNAPVWKAYGGLGVWEKRAPQSVTKNFEGHIPNEYQGKRLRIRALLEHRWGGPYANWPAFRYANDIGYQGILGTASTSPTTPETVVPEITATPELKCPDNIDEAYKLYTANYNQLQQLMGQGKGDDPAAQDFYKKYKFYKDCYDSQGITPPLNGTPPINGTPASSPQAPNKTVVPAVTTTPETGTTIVLNAYAKNYDQVTEVLDNSANFGSVSISGRVTDLNTGAAIGGATIEIASGATPGSTLSAADGSYSLTAVVPSGQDSGEIAGVDFALPVKADLTIEVIPKRTELAADGTSTSDITIQVKDLQGNPVKDRACSLEVSADAGPGTIQPVQAITDDNGIIHATYTAFKLEPGLGFSNARHEVTISARDNATGLVGSNSIFVSQYQLTILYGEYIPACARCTFPSKFTVLVTDYWNNPIPNAPLTLQIEGGSSGGTLVLDPNSNENQQEITLNTDNNGRATVYYKWRGSVDITEAAQLVVIIERATNAQETKVVKVQGLDIGIARVEEAGFTGVTGQQAFLKIYFKDLAHPDLPLERFNADTPNKLGLRVTIRQYHSDGVNTSLTFEDTAGWERDEKGLFVKMYGTPHMPYIIPANDGTSWYEVRVDPVIDHDVFLPDLFRPNNDTIIALTTGSPDGWLHIWLQDGVLTPHTWTGVVFKCVGRFLPLVGDAMTVIDTLNQSYNKDVLGLGQSTATVITEHLQGKSASGSLTKYKASAINNVISCLQDSYAVYHKKNQQGASRSIGGYTMLSSPLQGPIPFIAMDEEGAEMIAAYQDRYVQGVLLGSPDQCGVVVYGVEASHVALRTASGQVFEDSDRMAVGGNVAVYILPVDKQFQLEVASDHAFDIGVYEAGDNTTTRETIRHKVQPDANLTASMAIGANSDYDLKLDYGSDGVFEKTLKAQVMTPDVVKPQITGLHPKQGATVSTKDASILASYADNPGGIGIDPQAIKIFVDGVDLTSNADVQPESLSLTLSDIGAGEHTVRLVVSDLGGNATIAKWTFTVQRGFAFSPNTAILLTAVGGGVFLILLLGAVLLIWFAWRKRRRPLPVVEQGIPRQQPGMVQDKQGRWWYQDPESGDWSVRNDRS